MKKLKCESCGSNINIKNEKDKYVTCEYCNTTYSLKDNVDKIEEVQTNKLFIIIFIIVFALISSTSIIMFYLFGIGTKKVIEQTHKETQKTTIDHFDADFFNAPFSLYNGKTSSFFIGNMIDLVINNNNKNKDKIITVNYKDKDYISEDDLLSLKETLTKKDKDYNITYNYDRNGYIDIIKIK